MKTIVRFAVNNPVTVWMITLAVGLLGFISLSRLSIDLFPDISAPRLFIEVKAGERSPEEMETRFVDNIETIAVQQKGVLSVTTDVLAGAAVVTVEYDYGNDMDAAFLDLQKAIAPIEQSGADEVNITRFDPNSLPVVEAAFVSETPRSMAELRRVAEKQIVNRLVRIKGIAEVKLSGDQCQQIIVAANPQLLEVNSLTPSSITGAIEAYNRNVSGGYIEEAGQQYIIKGTGVFAKPNDLLNLVVGYRTVAAGANNAAQQGAPLPILLSEVAEVHIGLSDAENIVTINGKQCIGVSIYKETGYNTVKAVETLDREFKNIEQRLQGFRLVRVTNQGSVISGAIRELRDSALLGIILAVVVLFVFLRRVGITLVVSFAIPVSIIATFNLMYFSGLTINIMTLGGLALGAGMLIDNAIVAVENIFRHMRQGIPVREAVVEGIGDVGGALTASTITTIIVFLPVVFLYGASGELFKEQALTVAFSLVSSLLVAIVLIPVIIQQFFNSSGKKLRMKEAKPIELKGYDMWLLKVLKHRNLVLAVSLALIVVSGWLFTYTGSEFMPSSQSSELTLKTKLPAGTSLERTASVTENISRTIADITGEQSAIIYTKSGPASVDKAGETGGNNTASIKIVFADAAHSNAAQLNSQLEHLYSSVHGLEIEYYRTETGLAAILGTAGAPVEVQVTGSDIEQLTRLTAEIKSRLLGVEGLTTTFASFEEGAPEVSVKIDRYRAGLYNVSVATVMEQVSRFLQGSNAGSMEMNGEMIDIKLKMPDVTLAQLRSLVIVSETNRYLLTELADITEGAAPAIISHVNQNRTGKIEGYPAGNRPFSQLVASIESQLAHISLPAGYQIRVAGEELKRKESFGSLAFALVLSVILVYMVMASQFESLVHPFTILLSIPLAGVGVVLLFFVTGSNFNIMALIGVIMLAGIAVNNSILLVDAANRNRRKGMTRGQAIATAGQQRIRPILMTSATTILALLPLTFGFGESASLRAPMAMAVIGGLVSSTLLTLIVIPCLYDLLDRLHKS
ncbi:MAG: efflux RND transporter permease subunit [Cytophagaceae bacterium]|jgi:HAE1 family hydrophobic/amphiphilic exporter-1|nr:efflux RND transporter permease subunit [Cytophagaceae bacterium]